jgi:hypothetical protein
MKTVKLRQSDPNKYSKGKRINGSFNKINSQHNQHQKTLSTGDSLKCLKGIETMQSFKQYNTISQRNEFNSLSGTIGITNGNNSSTALQYSHNLSPKTQKIKQEAKQELEKERYNMFDNEQEKEKWDSKTQYFQTPGTSALYDEEDFFSQCPPNPIKSRNLTKNYTDVKEKQRECKALAYSQERNAKRYNKQWMSGSNFYHDIRSLLSKSQNKIANIAKAQKMGMMQNKLLRRKEIQTPGTHSYSHSQNQPGKREYDNNSSKISKNSNSNNASLERGKGYNSNFTQTQIVSAIKNGNFSHLVQNSSNSPFMDTYQLNNKSKQREKDSLTPNYRRSQNLQKQKTFTTRNAQNILTPRKTKQLDKSRNREKNKNLQSTTYNGLTFTDYAASHENFQRSSKEFKKPLSFALSSGKGSRPQEPMTTLHSLNTMNSLHSLNPSQPPNPHTDPTHPAHQAHPAHPKHQSHTKTQKARVLQKDNSKQSFSKTNTPLIPSKPQQPPHTHHSYNNSHSHSQGPRNSKHISHPQITPHNAHQLLTQNAHSSQRNPHARTKTIDDPTTFNHILNNPTLKLKPTSINNINNPNNSNNGSVINHGNHIGGANIHNPAAYLTSSTLPHKHVSNNVLLRTQPGKNVGYDPGTQVSVKNFHSNSKGKGKGKGKNKSRSQNTREQYVDSNFNNTLSGRVVNMNIKTIVIQQNSNQPIGLKSQFIIP